MTSLARCIKKAGKALNRSDADAIREIMAEGMSAEEAVSDYLDTLGDERAELVSEIEAQGGSAEYSDVVGDLTMEEIDFNTDLTPRQLEAQQAFAKQITSTPWAEVRAAYLAMKGETTGNAEDVEDGRILSVDAARELYEPYKTDRSLSNGTHEVASAIVKKLYAERLTDPVTPGEMWTWLAGGTGAGKTTGVRLSGFAGLAGLIYDGNLAKFDSAVDKIDRALKSGRLVHINYVFRDPREAFRNGVIKRAMKQTKKIGSGRTVHPETHGRTHAGSRQVVAQLRDHYQNDPRVIVEAVDNNNGHGNAKLSQVNNLPVLDSAAVIAAAHEELEEVRDEGIITEKLYNQFLEGGARSASYQREGDVAGYGGQLEQRGVGDTGPAAVNAPLYSRRTAEARYTADLGVYPDQGPAAPVSDNPEGRPAAPAGEPVQPIPTNLSQEEKVDIAHALAQENYDLMAPILDTISTRLGVELQQDIKTRDSTIGKANRPEIIVGKNRPWWNVEHLRDVFRFRGLLNNIEEAEQVLGMLNDMLQPQGGLIVVKADVEKYNTPTQWGWRPLAFDILMPNGQVSEFYMAPREMVEISDNQGHALFENWRWSDPYDLTPRQLRRRIKDIAESNRLYSGAYETYLQRNQISAVVDFASARKLAALAESLTSINESAKSLSVKEKGGLGVQTPSADRYARRSSSSMTTRPSSGDSRTDIRPLYSRDGGTQPAVMQAELQLALAPAIRALVGTVQVHVVQSTTELPGDAVPTDVEGMYRGGDEVWLVADNLPDAERAKKVFAHETFGHLAMEKQPEFVDVLAGVRNLLTMKNKAFTEIAAKVAETQGNLDSTTEAKEILAYMAENGIENGTIARAKAAIRSMLRRMGLLDGVSYSEEEIKALLVRAARDLVSGAEAKQAALSAMPLQEQIISDPDAVEAAVHLAIKEVYANATYMDAAVRLYNDGSPEAQQALYRAQIAPGVSPEVLDPEALYARAYHGTGAMFDKFDINYIGTGEGFQAFGWGLYFSSMRGVAEWYKSKLSAPTYTVGGKGVDRREAKKRLGRKLFPIVKKHAPDRLTVGGAPSVVVGTISKGVIGMMRRHNGSIAEVKNEIQNQIDVHDKMSNDAASIATDLADISQSDNKTDWKTISQRERMMAEGWAAAYKMVDDGKISYEGESGNLMEVEVPDNDDLLHYEDTLNEHSPEIVAKIKEHFPELFDVQWTDTVTGEPLSDEYIETLRTGKPAKVSRKASGRGWQRTGVAIAATEEDLEALGFTRDMPAESMTGDLFYRYVGKTVSEQDIGGFFSSFKAAVAKVSSDRLASEFIRDNIGIPGHSFIGAGSNELNYVIYDDSQIEMTAINDQQVAVAEEALFSRMSYGEHRAMTDMMRLRDVTKRVTPDPADAAAAQLGTDPGQPPGWYWKISSEAGTRAFGQPKGSWEERYYTELGRQASAAAKTANQQAPMPEEQMALFSKAPPVDSPAFSAWFGDSKVVDENGDPQEVYHGTTEDFSEFKKEFIDNPYEGGFFFSTSADVAGVFEHSILPVYLSIKNPLVMTPTEWYEGEYTTPEQIKAKGHDGILIKKDSSYEGIESDADVYVAFEPNQIKSSIGNRGTYDATSPNILFSRAIKVPNLRYQGVRNKFMVTVLKNPTHQELSRLVDSVEVADFEQSRPDGLRYMTDENGNTYFWDAADALHHDIVTGFFELPGDGPYFRTEQLLDSTEDIITKDDVRAGNLRGYEPEGKIQRLPPAPRAMFSRKVHSDPEIERIRAKALTPALEDITIKDRMRDLVQRVRGTEFLGIKQGILDSAASVENLERGIFGNLLDASESAYKSMLATRNLGSVMAAIMHRGIPIYQNGVFTARADRQGLIDIFQKITHHKDGNLLPLWELYAVAVRSNRLIKEKNPDGTSKEKVLTQEEINKALTLEAEYPEFKTAFMEWQKFNSQLLDLAIKRGVINAAEAAMWRKNDYVPFYRAMEEIEYQGGQGPQTGGGIANVRSGIKRLTGSETQIGNVFENMVMNTSYLIDAVYRNTAMQRVVAMADGIAMTKIPMAYEAMKFKDGDIARALMRAGLIVGRGSTEADMFNDGIRQVKAMTAEQKEHWSTLFRRVAPRGDNVVSVLIQGKPVYYEVSDPLLFRSIAAMGAQSHGGIMHTFRFAKRTLTKAVTIDPAFMMANFIRDTLSSAVVLKGSGVKQMTEAMKGLKAAWNEDPVMLDLMMAGAGGGGFYDHNPADIRKMLAKKMPAGEVNAFANSVLTPRGLWRFWQKVGNASEQANRVGVARRVLEAGGTAAEAAYQARDVLNFTMAGDYEAMKIIVQTVPFINARMQGLYRLYRGGKENPVGFTMKGLTITAATMALLMKNLDDDRYKELPEWDKDTYWHFFIGDEHFRLPKPFEVGALFATVFERAFMLGTGDDNLDITINRAWHMVADTLSFNPVPQLLKPVAEQYANRNMFTGNPIIGLAHEGLEPEAQYDPWTSETMRELAKILPGWGGSPKRLQAFMRGYLGATGMYALGAADAVTRRAFGHPDRPKTGIHNYPVITRFWRDPSPRTSKYSAQMYDMLRETDAIYRTMNAYRTQGRVGEAAAMMEDGRGKLAARAFLHDVAADVRKINAQLKRVQFSDMGPDEKKAAVDKLNEAKLSVMRKVARVSDIF